MTSNLNILDVFAVLWTSYIDASYIEDWTGKIYLSKTHKVLYISLVFAFILDKAITYGSYMLSNIDIFYI